MEQTVKCMRSREIDIAKGIGILLVVLGHAVPDANIGIQNKFWATAFNWIYSFHMALFMAMAGVLFFRKAVACQSLEEKCRELKNRGGKIACAVPFLFSVDIGSQAGIFLVEQRSNFRPEHYGDIVWKQSMREYVVFMDVIFRKRDCFACS